MNCPHNAKGKGMCRPCLRAYLAEGVAPEGVGPPPVNELAIVRQLARCDHELVRQTDQATGTHGLWCPTCGARRSWQPDAPWLPSELQRQAMGLDGVLAVSGALPTRPRGDSARKKRIRAKSRT
jgi:hypothetical protein